MNREERDAAFGNFTAALEVHLVRFRKQLAAKYGIQPRTSDRRLPRAEKEKEDRARLAELDLQIASCIRLEREFQETLVADEAGRKVFTTFLKELAASGKTAAHARQYFRERAIVFNRFVVPEVKRGAWMGVNKFSLNWNFVLWVLSRCKIPPAIATYLRKIHIPTAVGAPLITSPDLVAHLATLTLAIFKHRDDVAVKYFCATMLIAFIDQPSGKSMPRCSKTALPVIGFIITESRLCHVSMSYAFVFGFVNFREIPKLPNCAITLSLFLLPFFSCFDFGGGHHAFRGSLHNKAVSQ
jgi:hypothetical protein